MTLSQLTRWANQRALIPSLQSGGGRGSSRLYDFFDLLAARVLGLLAGRGRVSGERQRRALGALAAARGQRLDHMALHGDLQSGRWQVTGASAETFESPASVGISLGFVADELRTACAAEGLPVPAETPASQWIIHGPDASRTVTTLQPQRPDRGGETVAHAVGAAGKESTPAAPGYTIAQAVQITGHTRRQLEHLDTTALVSPSLRRPGGKRRYYSFFELVELRTIARLRGDGEERISLQKIRKVVVELEKVRYRPLQTCTLLSDGGTTFWLDEDGRELEDALGRWPVLLAVSLDGLEWEVRRECHRLELLCPPPDHAEDASRQIVPRHSVPRAK